VPDRYPAIEDHAVIGDLHTVALVATDGPIDWCCLPRSDSPAVFASLLDADRGGCFAVPSEAVRTRQLYKPDTKVLVTRFLGTDSVGEVVDFTVPRHLGIPLMRLGPVLVRGQRAVRGTVVFTITCRPAFDFGRQDHAVHAPDHGGAVFVSPGAQAERVLCGSQRFSVARAAATATVTLGPEDGLDLLLEWGGPHPPRPAARARRHPGPPERHRPRGTPLDRRRQPQRPLLQRAIRRAGHHQARRLLHERPCRCRHHARPGCVRLRRPDRMHQTHDGPCSSRAAAFDGHTRAVLDGPAISKPAGSVASSRNAPAD